MAELEELNMLMQLLLMYSYAFAPLAQQRTQGAFGLDSFKWTFA